jgi:hypothetical protein
MTEDQEKKRKRGIIITVAIVGAIALGFYFLLFVLTTIRG